MDFINPANWSGPLSWLWRLVFRSRSSNAITPLPFPINEPSLSVPIEWHPSLSSNDIHVTATYDMESNNYYDTGTNNSYPYPMINNQQNFEMNMNNYNIEIDNTGVDFNIPSTASQAVSNPVRRKSSDKLKRKDSAINDNENQEKQKPLSSRRWFR